MKWDRAAKMAAEDRKGASGLPLDTTRRWWALACSLMGQDRMAYSLVSLASSYLGQVARQLSYQEG